jgi:hypothetical protein
MDAIKGTLKNSFSNQPQIDAKKRQYFYYQLMLRSTSAAQAAKPADEAKPRPVQKKTNTRRRVASKAGLAACAADKIPPVVTSVNNHSISGCGFAAPGNPWPVLSF